MVRFTTHSFAAKDVRSLSWRGDELVDWVGGGRSFSLTGDERRAGVAYAYAFDAATASPDGRFAAIYERQGTKGLLLDNGKILRELNRSFYQAKAYEYPIALFDDRNGRVLLAHCPQKYNRVELEDAVTGRALTASEQRQPSDFFHSRLSASPTGKRLLSAGWIWSPWDAVVSFDVARALVEPVVLDRGEPLTPGSGYEEGSACWLDDNTIVAGGTVYDENLDPDREPDASPNLSPRGVAVYDLVAERCVAAFQLDALPGTMFAIDADHVLSLYRHPKLIDLKTGNVVHVWHDLDSGLQASSIVWSLKAEDRPPAMAFDAATKRFAIANRDAVTVIQFTRDGG